MPLSCLYRIPIERRKILKVIDVVAGIIFDQTNSKVLLALRKPEQHQGNLWEFPGGKLEVDESPSQGLRRELLEEIGISVAQSVHRLTLEHRYSDKHVRLYFRDVVKFEGTPAGLEGQQLDWVPIEKLPELSFPQANQPVVEALIQSVS